MSAAAEKIAFLGFSHRSCFMCDVWCRWHGWMLRQCQVCGVLTQIGSQASAAAEHTVFIFPLAHSQTQLEQPAPPLPPSVSLSFSLAMAASLASFSTSSASSLRIRVEAVKGFNIL